MKACFIISFQLSNLHLQNQLQQWVLGCDSLEYTDRSELAQLHVWDWNQFSACSQGGKVLPKNLIVFSETADAKREQQVLQSGALDYICEPFHMDNICLRLSQHVQRVRYVAQLENLSVTDTLTELFNRRKFNQDLDKCWRQNMRQKCTSSLLLIDVDHFKKFNDEYGHVAGDQCLYQLAQVLKQEAVRPHDIAARIGGEEFAIILPQTPKEGAMHVAKRILQGVQALKIKNARTELGFISISVGLASAGTQLDVEQWQKSADDALYQAKNGGRNRVVSSTGETFSWAQALTDTA
jgi:diguanylate cyclase (GGDEF)-like protein